MRRLDVITGLAIIKYKFAHESIIIDAITYTHLPRFDVIDLGIIFESYFLVAFRLKVLSGDLGEQVWTKYKFCLDYTLII